MPFDPTLRPFFLPPNWSQQVMERLQFRTDAIVSEDYTTQTRATRVTPRRSFEYHVFAHQRLRQRFANATYGGGAATWYLPLWIDGVELSGSASSGSDTVLVNTAARPFFEGGAAFLQSPDMATFELVETASVGPVSLGFSGTLANSYPAGSRVYPCLRAQIDQQFSQNAFIPGAAYGRVKLNVTEPNPFPVHEWSTVYRGYPVLTDRPETSRDPESVFQWMLDGLDDEVGIPSYRDPVGIPLYRQSHDWALTSRSEIDRFRGIAYALEGKQKSLWLPTWADDLSLNAQLNAGQTGLQVARCGAAAIAEKTNRRDLRIETTDGVYYRRIASANDPGTGAYETLTLDAALPVTLAEGSLRQICFMALARSETDSFEFDYFTGEAAKVAMAWRARQHDV